MRGTAGNVTCPANIFSPGEHRKGGVNTFEYIYSKGAEPKCNF